MEINVRKEKNCDRDNRLFCKALNLLLLFGLKIPGLVDLHRSAYSITISKSARAVK